MIRVTSHGTREMLVGSIILLALGAGLGWIHWALSLIVLPVIVWLFAFFRDPERAIPTDPNIMVSPADGVVSDITEIEHDERIGGPGVRIGIFLSVFNVHINRVPCEGKISRIEYKKGKFINAMHHNEASSDNESNTITLINEKSGKPVAVVKQIVGLIARRIICDPGEGASLARGQRFGMIKFGSRTELYVPKRLSPTVSTQVGAKVRGGLDILVRLGKDLSE